MSFVVFAWIASIAYGLEFITEKLVSKYSLKNPFAFGFFSSLITLLLTLPFALANHINFPKDMGIIVLVGLFYTLTTIFYSLSLYKLDVSLLSPLFNLRTGIVVILSIFLLGEVLTAFQYLLIFILVISGFILTIEEKFSFKSFFRKEHFSAFLCMIFLSLWNIYTKKAIVTNGFWEVNLWGMIFSQIFMLPTILFFTKEIKNMSFKSTGALVLVAFGGTIGTLTANKAFATNVSITK